MLILKGSKVDGKKINKPFYVIVQNNERGTLIDKARKQCNGFPLCVYWILSPEELYPKEKQKYLEYIKNNPVE